MFSKSCEYGLQAMIYIALHSNGSKNVGVKEIAKEQEIPSQYLSKIMQQLVKQKLVDSMKGPNGGFFIKKNPDKLSLLEIVIAIDGHDMFDRCSIGLKKCSDKDPCPIHNEYKLVKHRIKEILKQKTLTLLCEDIRSGKSIVNFKRSL